MDEILFKCNKCSIDKSFSEFYKNSRDKSRPRLSCKKCDGLLQKIRTPSEESISKNTININGGLFKICTGCLIQKPVLDFYRQHGLFKSKCRKCTIKSVSDYTKENYFKISPVKKEYYNKNRSIVLLRVKTRVKNFSSEEKQKHTKYLKAKGKEWRCNNKQYIKERAKSRSPIDYKRARERFINDPIYREKIRAKSLEYRANPINREKIRKSVNERQRVRRGTEPMYRAVQSLRCRVLAALKGKNKSKKTLDLLGISKEGFKSYIESKFTDGMAHENYGKFGWNLDHIAPTSSFNLVDPEQQKICFHYTNLQPLWWYDNLFKSNKSPEEWYAYKTTSDYALRVENLKGRHFGGKAFEANHLSNKESHVQM